MREFSKTSILTAVALVAGGILLWAPTQASAQFNIEGMIRGAIGHPYYGSGGYHSRSSSHHAKSHSKQDDDTAATGDKSDKTKEKDATQVEAPSNNVSSRPSASASGPVQDAASRSVETDAPARPSGGSAPSSDQPAFAPSR